MKYILDSIQKKIQKDLVENHNSQKPAICLS